MDIPQVWQNLTQGQGTVIAAIITVIAALGGVVLGWLLFSGRVRNLETALDASERKVQDHLQRVESSLQQYESRLNDQLSDFALQLSRLSGSVADIPTTSRGSSIEPAQQNAQDNMRESWTRIRDLLEQIASKSQIDGRTRAWYNRIDRRRYEDLVSALQNDGQLGENAASYRDAVELWQRFRSGRATPSTDEVRRMGELAKRLTGVCSHGS